MNDKGGDENSIPTKATMPAVRLPESDGSERWIL